MKWFVLLLASLMLALPWYERRDAYHENAAHLRNQTEETLARRFILGKRLATSYASSRAAETGVLRLERVLKRGCKEEATLTAQEEQLLPLITASDCQYAKGAWPFEEETFLATITDGLVRICTTESLCANLSPERIYEHTRTRIRGAKALTLENASQTCLRICFTARIQKEEQP